VATVPGLLRGMLPEFLLVSFEHRLLNQGAHVPVDRVRNILVGTVGSLAARHRHEVPVVTLDNLHTPYDEGVIEGNICKTSEFFLVPEGNSDLSDLHAAVPCRLKSRRQPNRPHRRDRPVAPAKYPVAFQIRRVAIYSKDRWPRAAHTG
jgi:hypothetical protein